MRGVNVAGSIIGGCLLLLLTACAASGPIMQMRVESEYSLLRWDELIDQSDEDCYSLYTKYNKWGVFIGCQAIDIFDVRTPTVNSLFTDNLTLQGCSTKPRAQGKRNYIRTGEHLLFIDKTGGNANAWFVPAGYYSDGVSTPDVLREILPGAILDTESPKTLSAALFHDRYFCLYEYSSYAWQQDRESYPSKLSGLRQNGYSLPVAYRRKGCANISFRNGLRAAGASSLIATVFRRMVGIVNPGKIGYCPQFVHAEALSDLDNQLEAMLGVGPIGTAGRRKLPGCRANEPVILCLSRVETLWFLVATRADDYAADNTSQITDEWRQVLTRVMCYEIQARDANEGNWPWREYFNQTQAEQICGSINVNALPSGNEDLRIKFSETHNVYAVPNLPIESPFRAGDFLVEGAFMLTKQEGPETFLRTVSGVGNIDYAMLAIVQWNEQETPKQLFYNK